MNLTDECINFFLTLRTNLIYFFPLIVNVIVVLDQERVYNDLKKQFGNKVQVVHLPKSGGVSRNSSTF